MDKHTYVLTEEGLEYVEMFHMGWDETTKFRLNTPYCDITDMQPSFIDDKGTLIYLYNKHVVPFVPVEDRYTMTVSSFEVEDAKQAGSHLRLEQRSRGLELCLEISKEHFDKATFYDAKSGNLRAYFTFDKNSSSLLEEALYMNNVEGEK